MAAAAHPPETRQSLGPSPPSCLWRLWAPLLFSALGAELPCGGTGQGAGGGARIPSPRAFARVPAREHLCTAILDSLPQSLPLRGVGGKGEGTRGARVQPQPLRGPGAELARGEIRKDARENYNAQSSSPSPQPAPAPALPDTHPRALTPRKQPRRPALAAALVAQAPPAGGRAPIPARRRPQGSRRGGGGQRRRREDGVGSLLEHRLLLLLFFLLPIHDGQNDFPLLLREVAEVGHLGLQRRLRGRRSGSRATPRPGWSRHVWGSLTTLGKQGGNSTSGGGGSTRAGGWGSLRRWDQYIQINGLQSEATAPLPQERKRAGGRGGRARTEGGLRSARREVFLQPPGAKGWQVSDLGERRAGGRAGTRCARSGRGGWWSKVAGTAKGGVTGGSGREGGARAGARVCPAGAGGARATSEGKG